MEYEINGKVHKIADRRDYELHAYPLLANIIKNLQSGEVRIRL